MVDDFVKGWSLRRNRGKDLLNEMLDSGWNNTFGGEFVLIISDTSVKRQLIKFDFIEEDLTYKLPGLEWRTTNEQCIEDNPQ